MKVSSNNLISQLLFGDQSKKTSKGPIADGSEIAELAKNSGGLRQAAENAFGDAAQIQITGPAEDINETVDAAPVDEAPAEPPVQSTPPEETEIVEEDVDDSTLKALAARYVDLYEKNSGNDLSDLDEEPERVEDVADFYGGSKERIARLENLVKSLEQEV